MPKLLSFLFFICTLSHSFCQYKLRGFIKDNNGTSLRNVIITLYSTKKIYKSDSYGKFAIPSSRISDTLSFSLNKYINSTLPVNTKEFLAVELEPIRVNAERKFHLNSISRDTALQKQFWTYANESYTNLVFNPFVKSSKSPSISFSPNTNKASYSNVRRFLNMNERVPPDAVRIEEMLNYFNLNYIPPKKEDIFNCISYRTKCPWNNANDLLMINVSARKVKVESVSPCNLVFLIDASGSMDLPNKLPILKSGFRHLVKNLRSIDTVSIITYGAAIKVVIDGASGSEKEKIIRAIENIEPDGETPGEAGIRAGYKVASRHYIECGNNRIILATDGDFNVGKTSEKDLENLIAEQEQKGVYLTCLGVGIGNYKDSKLFLLAQKGNGNFAYLDNEQESERVLVTEFTQTLYSVADNVTFQLSIDPRFISSYRLIGYDNRIEALSDSSSTVEGGEIGSGHSLSILFEIVPGNAIVDGQNIANLAINYQVPGSQSIQKLEFECSGSRVMNDSSANNIKKAAGIAMLGLKLKQVPGVFVSWRDLETYTRTNFTSEAFFDKEFISIVAKAKKIYNHKRNAN